MDLEKMIFSTPINNLYNLNNYDIRVFFSMTTYDVVIDTEAYYNYDSAGTIKTK